MYRYNFRDWGGVSREVNVVGTMVLRVDDIRLYVVKKKNEYAVHYGLQCASFLNLEDAMHHFGQCFCHAAECGDVKSLQTSKTGP